MSTLFQKMTSRKASGFNVWQNDAGLDKRPLSEAKRIGVSNGNPLSPSNNGSPLSPSNNGVYSTNKNVAQKTYSVQTSNKNYDGNHGNGYPGNSKVVSSDNRTRSNNAANQKLATSTSLSMKGEKLKISPSQQPNPDNLIGNYLVERTLGKGTFAKVKLAKHLPTGKEVAIKIIDKNELSESDLIKIYREIRIMKILNHPNIVRLYEVIENDRYLHLILEYVPKGEIFDFVVKNGRLQEADARKKFRQIISAIEYCHRKCIVHRDLKVENLLLDSQMGIKICDFGFSNEFTTNGKLNTFCGSPPYAAPELFLGKNYIGPEVDVWSLGVVLYTLLCGALPFDGKSVKELKERIMKGAYYVPAYLSQPSREMIKKFLCVMPSRRITLQAALNEGWVNQGYELNPLKPFHEEEEIIDYTKIEQMAMQGYDKDKLLDSVKGEKFDDLYAIYKLTPLKKSEKLPPNRIESNGSFLSTPLRRSLREHNNNNNISNNENKMHSMRISPSQKAAANGIYQSTNFIDQRSASGSRGSVYNIAGEAVPRRNGPSAETKYRRNTTNQIQTQKHATLSSMPRNTIYCDPNSTLRNSFKANQPVAAYSNQNNPALSSNGRYITRNETQTSFLKKPKPLKSPYPLNPVSMSTRTPSVTSHHVGSRNSTSFLSTMNGSRLGNRSASMKGSSSKLISTSSKTNLTLRQSSIQSLNVTATGSNRNMAFLRQAPIRSTIDLNAVPSTAPKAPASGKIDTKNETINYNKQFNSPPRSPHEELAPKSKSSIRNWFKKKK